MKVTINNAAGVTQACKGKNCFHWVFDKAEDGTITCGNCKTVYTFGEGEVEGVFPRPGRDFTDRYNQIQRYSFFRGADGTGTVRRVPMRSGNWIEKDAGMQILSEAQDEINSLRARLARLEPKAV